MKTPCKYCGLTFDQHPGPSCTQFQGALMKPQLWYCEMCGVLGALMYREHEDVMSVVHTMGDQHRKASPECENGCMGLRSIVIENIHEPFVLRPHESIKR